MTTVKAEDIRMGDTIQVDLGMGKTSRIVDKVDQNGDDVTITLFASFGIRPKFTVNKNITFVRE